jgi:murein DD-endopeptidase MepM/ murein hydrolase activator NlpD
MRLVSSVALVAIAVFSTSPTSASADPIPRSSYRPPVHRPITDPFRAPANRYAAGNRGLDYDTVPGDPIAAIGTGTVTFAGSIAHQLFVTVRHPDGLDSTYSFLAELTVHRGQRVVRGQQVGVAGETFHLGVRRGDQYLDPARLFGRGRAVLVRRRRVAPPLHRSAG